jgi:SAC3 family protein LENG8/THP3
MLTVHSYLSVTLKFLTKELEFDNIEACREFFESHGAQNMIENDRVIFRNNSTLFESLRAAAFSKVDIKGQK